MRGAFVILEAPAAYGPAPLSFDLFGSITTLYRRGLKAVHLENRGKQLRAETAISGLQRRATASRNGGVFYARNVAEPPITVLWGVAIGKPSGLSVYLFVRSFQPDSDPRPSIGNRERELR